MPDVPNPRHGSVISTRSKPLPVARTPPWDRWFARALYLVRYGYGHPDEDLLPVIDAAGDALSVQITAARAVLHGTRAVEAQRIQADLNAELASELPDFSTLLGIEARINALYPPTMAARRKWMIEERFARLAAGGAYASWLCDPRADGADQDAAADLATGAAEPMVPGVSSLAAAEARLSAARQLVNAEADKLVGPAAGADDVTRKAELAALSETGDDADAGRIAELSAQLQPLLDAEQALREAEMAYEQSKAAADATAPASEAEAAGGVAGEGSGAMPPAGGSAVGPLTPERADAQTLLGYIHTHYLMAIGREKAVRDLKQWLMLRFWAFIGLFFLGLLTLWFGLGLFQQQQHWDLLLALAVISAVGRIGATTSIVRRLQTVVQDNVLAKDPIIELAALRTGRRGFQLALVSSSIFALLMYAFFATGVPEQLGFKDGIFPTLAESRAAENAEESVENQIWRTREERRRAVENQAEAVAELTEARAAAEAASAGTAAAGTGGGPGADDVEAIATLLAARRQLAELEAALAASEEAVASLERENTAVSKPAIGAPADAKAGEDPIKGLAVALGLKDRADFFKLLIWAFIAGFAERFVPDVLDRIIARTTGAAADPASIAAAQARNVAAAAPASTAAGEKDKEKSRQTGPPADQSE